MVVGGCKIGKLKSKSKTNDAKLELKSGIAFPSRFAAFQFITIFPHLCQSIHTHTRLPIIALGRSTPSSPSGTPSPRSLPPCCSHVPHPSAADRCRCYCRCCRCRPALLLKSRKWSRASPLSRRPRACASWPPARPPWSRGGRPRATSTRPSSAAMWWRRALIVSWMDRWRWVVRVRSLSSGTLGRSVGRPVVLV